MNTIYKVCKKEIIPSPKKITYNSTTEDEIVSTIMKHSEMICKKVCTFENKDYSRTR